MTDTDTVREPSPFLSVAALLVGVALLITGNGLQLMLVPIRGGIEGFTEFQIGYLGSSYFLGFVLGCWLTPHLILRAGHIRTFAALVSVASAVALAFPLAVNPLIWAIFRLFTGFCLAGLYLVVESWLNDRATNETRGALISTYVAINFIVTVLGQMMVTLFQPSSFILFSLASILVSVAAVPVALTRSAQPPPLTLVRFRPRYMFNLSPAGTISIFLIGMATGSFWSLGPVFANQVSGDVTIAAVFMSAVVLGGAIIQWPAGLISDHLDRRLVLVALGSLSVVAGFGVLLLPQLSGWALGIAFLFGAGLLPTYAVAAAHVYDFAERSDFVELSAGLLLLNGLGAVFGPLVASWGMGMFGPRALFFVNAAIFLFLIGFVGTRLLRHRGLSADEKQSFDYATAGAVAVVGDEDAVLESELIVDVETLEPIYDATDDGDDADARPLSSANKSDAD